MGVSSPPRPTLLFSLSALTLVKCLDLTCGLVMFFPLLPILQFQEIKSNKTVLHLAVKEGNIDLVRYLLRIPLPNMKDFVNMKVSSTLI